MFDTKPWREKRNKKAFGKGYKAGRGANLVDRVVDGFFRDFGPRNTEEQKSEHAGWKAGLKANDRRFFSLPSWNAPRPSAKSKASSYTSATTSIYSSSADSTSSPPCQASLGSSTKGSAGWWLFMAVALGMVWLAVHIIETSSQQPQPHRAKIINRRVSHTHAISSHQSHAHSQANNSATESSQESPASQLPVESYIESAPKLLSSPDIRAANTTTANEGREKVYEPPQIIYFAKHKHGIGGCDGQIQLRSNEFRFVAGKHALRLSREAIKRIDGPGIVDLTGKKWHFRIEGKSDEETATIFGTWFNSK